MERGWLPQVLPHSRQRSSYRLILSCSLSCSHRGRAGNSPKTRNPLFPDMEKEERDAELCTPNLMFPASGRELTPGDRNCFRSGCRGFAGLVPQPLCMKSKSALEEQTCVIVPGGGSVRHESGKPRGDVTRMHTADNEDSFAPFAIFALTGCFLIAKGAKGALRTQSASQRWELPTCSSVL